MALESWFALSEQQSLKDRKAQQDAAVFISSIVLAVVFGVLPMPVVWKWVGWFFCFWGFIYIIQAVVDPINRLPGKTRKLAMAFLLLIVICGFSTTALSQWREEMAAVVEGDLVGAGPALDDGKLHGFPMVQIGEGTTFVMTPDGVSNIFPFFKDSGVRIEWGKRAPLLTTTIRDRNGNLVAEIRRNHWKVYPQYCADKNYTKDAIEIQDSAGHVVLQAKILPGKIRIQGEWWDTQGSGVRMLQMPDPKMGSQVVHMNRQNQHNDALIEPMFEYSSKDHWGELVQK
jgi:hypothetical protein